jgi:hypothetical protein
MSQIKDSDFLEIPTLKEGNKSSLDKMLEKKKAELEQKILKNPKKHNSSAWIIVFILMITLVGLGTFTLNELKTSNESLVEIKQQQVAGAKDVEGFSYPPISGYGFTILPNQKVAESFKLDRSTGQSKVFPQRTSVVSSFLVEELRDGKKMKSGIEVEVLEYDNKYNQTEFTEIVKKSLPSNFETTSTDIIIPRSFKISRIEDKDKVGGLVYYTAVTTDNYYVIKIFNQTKDYQEFLSINRFTESILQNLYLN